MGMLKRTATAFVAVPTLYFVMRSDAYFSVLAVVAMQVLVAECHLEMVVPIVQAHAGAALAYPLPLVAACGLASTSAALTGNAALLMACLVALSGLLVAWTVLIQVTRHALPADIRVVVALGVQLLAFAFATGGLSALTLLRLESGWGALFFLFGCCWQADNGALFVGSAFGARTPRFLPTISPKKSYAGVAGALVFSCASGYAFAWLERVGAANDSSDGGGAVGAFARAAVPPLPFADPATSAVAGLVLGVAAIVGDALASLLKRVAGRKDSGRLFPGHGGIVDRMDSLMVAAPLLWGLLHASHSDAWLLRT